ncbi:MAG TPA: HAMP domain-containing protein, partial [Polyangia bacterium]|nr:HAMP domain-containing protein [Polyangia bacterium]
MKLASKFALAVVLIMAVVFGIRGYQGVERQIAATEANIREDQFIIGRALRPALTEVWRSEGPQRALQVLAFADERIRRSRSVQIRWVPLAPTLTEDQRQRISALDLAQISRDSEATVVRTEGDHLVTYVPVMIDGRVEGAIQISEALTSYQKEIRDDVRAVIRRSVAGALMSILAITALGFAIVGRPVRRLVEKARRIGAGDLTGPLDIRQRDEIGELAREMNQMCDRLRAAQQRIGEEADARIAALEQLRHADRLTTVGTLASGIAHELGTPLSVVSGHTTMIATGEVVGIEARESARVASDQVHRITRIIRQLLDFARRRSPERGRYALKSVIGETLTLLRPMAQKRGVELRVTTGGVAIDADVDPTQIQQAVTNLVLNGIQAT